MQRSVLMLAVLAVLFGAGCQSTPEKHYAVQGEVISTDAPHGTIMLKLGDIPGFMPAMTMAYSVADSRQIGTLQSGDTISADLVVGENKERLEKIRVISKGTGKPSQDSSQHVPQKGEEVPDIALVNQDGKPVHLRNYRGKTVLVTFIYTRCPLPDFCPRMNENFRQIQGLLRENPAAPEETAFLSISFDPEHDTPAVLKHYAGLYKKQSPGQPAFDWQFAVPATKDLPDIAKFFGLDYAPEQGQIVHTLTTTLIGPDGKVAAWYDGNEWSAAEVAHAMSALFDKT
jgi:protein SCO1